MHAIRICVRGLVYLENYREQREYDNQMIAKLFAVKFDMTKESS